MQALHRTRVFGIVTLCLLAACLALGWSRSEANPGPGPGKEINPEDLVFETIRVPAGADTTLHSWFPYDDLGDRATLTIRSEEVARALLRFDLTSLPYPNRMAVARATLRVYVQSGTNPLPLEVSAYALNRSWEEREANWYRANAGTLWDAAGANGVPGDRAGTLAASAGLSRGGEWVELDVTGLVREWIAGQRAAHGVALQGESRGAVGYTLASSEYSDPDLRPHLSILYSVLPTATPTQTAMPTATATPGPVLAVEKVGPAGPLQVHGQTITYNITVRNVGSDLATDVSLVDTLPLGTVFSSASENGVYDAQQHAITWTGLSLHSGESKVVVIHVDLAAWTAGAGQIVNVVEARCDGCAPAQAQWETLVIPESPSPTPTLRPTPPPWKTYLVEVYDQR